jgi:hypothetical protein
VHVQGSAPVAAPQVRVRRAHQPVSPVAALACPELMSTPRMVSRALYTPLEYVTGAATTLFKVNVAPTTACVIEGGESGESEWSCVAAQLVAVPCLGTPRWHREIPRDSIMHEALLICVESLHTNEHCKAHGTVGW